MRLVIMAKETNLKDLDTSLSKEEEDIVDSIISELNQDIPGDKSEEGLPKSVDVNIEKVQLQQQQQQQQQQKMMQQQMMQQQMIQQQMMQRQKNTEVEEKEKEISLVDKLKLDLQLPGIVAILTFLAVLPHSAKLIESMKITFLLDGANLNLYGLILKSLLMGFVYFVITKYVLV